VGETAAIKQLALERVIFVKSGTDRYRVCGRTTLVYRSGRECLSSSGSGPAGIERSSHCPRLLAPGH